MRSPAEWKRLKEAEPEHPDVRFVTRPVDKGLLERSRALAESPEMKARLERLREG